MNELLLALQPRDEVATPPLPSAEAEEDALFIASSITHFFDFVEETSHSISILGPELSSWDQGWLRG